jgi:hypothetical protein
MKPLPIQFDGRGSVRGYIFTQELITDKAYLYKVERNGSIHWEVFKKRENTRFGNISYPSDEAFGKWAWTYSSFERAKIKFDELNGEG